MRHADWVARLRETVDAYRAEPFSWGRHNCGLFPARCVDAITGSDFAREFQFATARAALAFVKDSGGIEAAVTARLGKPTEGRCARRGDVCLVDVVDGDGLGICYGPEVLVASDDGLESYALARVRKHWRVG